MVEKRSLRLGQILTSHFGDPSQGSGRTYNGVQSRCYAGVTTITHFTEYTMVFVESVNDGGWE